MKILLVTSEITYVPNNYQSLFENLLRTHHADIVGLVVLKNFNSSLLKTVAGLFYLGCPKVAMCLLQNTLGLLFRKRERLFKKYHIPVMKFSTMNSPEALEWVNKYSVDLIVNARTRCIYKTPILTAPKLGCINIHHGILPEYRGTLCDLYALAENRPAGFSIHMMNEKIDDGKILKTQVVSLPNEKNYLKYLSRTGEAEAKTLGEVIDSFKLPSPVFDAIPSQGPGLKIVMTKNPTREVIRQMKTKGMVL